MTYQFIANMIASVIIGGFSLGAFYVCWLAAREADRERKRTERVARLAKLTALRRIGMDRNRPLDVWV